MFHMSPWVDHVYLVSVQITILTTVSFTESFALTAHHNLSWCHVFLAELFSMQFSGGRPRNSTRSKMEFFIIIDSIVSTVIPFLITNFFFNEKKAINACVHYFLSNFYFFIKWQAFKNYEKCFLFHVKISFCSRDTQIFVIFPFPHFLDSKGQMEVE